MILEVNNTFDERRIYLMEHSSAGSLSTFTHEWGKDFHVSPLNSRDGSYSLIANNVFSRKTYDMGIVDNTIVLKSANGEAKLIARVFSEGSSLDVQRMSSWETIDFVLRWWWVGFMASPRILREARNLWVKKLQVFSRPEVTRSSIGRTETPEEAALELYIRALIVYLVQRAPKNLRVRYIPAAGSNRGRAQAITNQDPAPRSENDAVLELRILTQAF